MSASPRPEAPSPDRPAQGSGGGRRRVPTRAGRLHPLLLLAVLTPVLTAAVALGLRVPTASPTTQPPESAPLTRADRGCPGSPGDGARVLVADTLPAAAGEVELRAVAEKEAEPEPLTVRAGETVVVDDAASLVVTGREQLAPGLLALRVAEGPTAAVVCPAPSPETWFTGLGARAEHASTIQLQNPDVGAAVVDIDVLTRQGPAEVPELRGIRVPGHSSYLLDLEQTAPRRGDLAVRVAVTRGRLSATVRDRFERLGSDAVSEEWLAPQPAPASTATLLGLPVGRGSRTLTIANPGADQARVTLRLVSRESTFAPADLSEVRVRPGSLVGVRLGSVLRREVRRGAIGVQVESTVPVVSGLSSVVDGDLVTSPAVAPAEASSVLLPAGEASVVLAGGTASGLATLTFRSADGDPVGTEEVEVTPGRAYRVPVPEDAVVATLSVQRTTLAAVAQVAGDRGAVVLAFTSPDEVGLVPAVRPADR